MLFLKRLIVTVLLVVFIFIVVATALWSFGYFSQYVVRAPAGGYTLEAGAAPTGIVLMGAIVFSAWISTRIVKRPA